MAGMRIVAKSFTEVELDGKKYKIGKLTIGDFADFEEHVRAQREDKIIATAKRLYGDNIPQTVFDKALAPPTDAELEAQQGSVSGIGFLLWCALKKYHPDMTQEETSAMIGLDDLPALTKAMMPTAAKKNKAKVKP